MPTTLTRSTTLGCRFTDEVLAAIADRLASRRPERGGALLAVGDLVHLLLEDTHGQYTSASWDISQELADAVGAVELAGHGRLIGTVHTHPRGVPDPSQTDVHTTDLALEVNPHLSELIIAVVTEGTPREHDLPIGQAHRMSLHVLRRDPAEGKNPVRVRARITAIGADLRACGVALASATTTEEWTPTTHNVAAANGAASPTVRPPRLPLSLRVDGRERMVVSAGEQGGALLVDPDYPTVGPLALTVADHRPTVISSPWNPVAAPRPQLAALAAAAAGRAVAEATARVDGLVGSLTDKHVLLAGAGSVGSRLAEDLVRAGVGRLTVIDFDRVSGPNLARTVYTAADIGEPKPVALARHLQAINPAVRTHPIARHLGATDIAELLVGNAGGPVPDLVIGATDDMQEQALLAHHAYHAGIPLLACAIYRAAAAGEVIIVCPEVHTACWLCATGQSPGASTERPETNYGLGGRLVAEIALGPPIHLVTSVAAMTAIGLLAGPTRPAGAPLAPLLAHRRTLGLISTSPEWTWFPTIFPGMAHQHFPQSVWLSVPPNPECTVCGAHPVPPATIEQGAGLAALLHSLDVEGDIPAGADDTAAVLAP